MGADIHGIWQRKINDKWEDIPSTYEQRRHYQLFAVLAGVRNGYGFAGVPTGEVITPIAYPRGYPGDFAVDENDQHPISEANILTQWRREYYDEHEKLDMWMGEHSHSWLLGSEMIDWWENAPSVVKVGILDRGIYDSWDKKSVPEMYCGGVSGPGVVIVDDNEIAKQKTPNWTHIRCEWETLLKDELRYFFEEVERLVHEHKEIRFVFGFDN